MTKIVYNACYGGFGLGDAGIRRYAELKGLTLYPQEDVKDGMRLGFVTWWTVSPEERADKILTPDTWESATSEQRVASNAYYGAHTITARALSRTDPLLIQVVEELGAEANSMFSNLRIADVPAGQRYRIDEYDGYESVMTVDDYEWSTA